MTFSLSPGQAHDAPEGRKLLHRLGRQRENPSVVMDRAYQDNQTRQLASELGFTPVVPPLKTRIDPWEYDREVYKKAQRNRAPVPPVEGLSPYLFPL